MNPPGFPPEWAMAPEDVIWPIGPLPDRFSTWGHMLVSERLENRWAACTWSGLRGFATLARQRIVVAESMNEMMEPDAVY